MTETALDRAWAASEAGGDAETARFWEVFAATELFLAIDPATLVDEAPKPLTFPVDAAETALAFDTEARLAAFMGDEAAHLTLSGRALAEMCAGAGAQLGLNLGDAPSATVLPLSALEWAAEALRQPIEAAQGDGVTLTKPFGAEPDLLARIDARLAGLGSALAEAWLCGAEGEGLLLCLRLEEPAAERAAVAALAETARFAGGAQAAFAIAVLDEGDRRLEAARRVGFGFETGASSAPTMRPFPPGPPKLR